MSEAMSDAVDREITSSPASHPRSPTHTHQTHDDDDQTIHDAPYLAPPEPIMSHSPWKTLRFRAPGIYSAAYVFEVTWVDTCGVLELKSAILDRLNLPAYSRFMFTCDNFPNSNIVLSENLAAFDVIYIFKLLPKIEARILNLVGSNLPPLDPPIGGAGVGQTIVDEHAATIYSTVPGKGVPVVEDCEICLSHVPVTVVSRDTIVPSRTSMEMKAMEVEPQPNNPPSYSYNRAATPSQYVPPVSSPSHSASTSSVIPISNSRVSFGHTSDQFKLDGQSESTSDTATYSRFPEADEQDYYHSYPAKKRPRLRTPVACEPCIKLKAGCDKSRPCTRCVKRNVQHLCVDRKKGRGMSQNSTDNNPAGGTSGDSSQMPVGFGSA